MLVSKYNRALAYEEIRESEKDLNDFLPVRYLSISSGSTDTQTVIQVVTVSGNITVSF